MMSLNSTIEERRKPEASLSAMVLQEASVPRRIWKPNSKYLWMFLGVSFTIIVLFMIIYLSISNSNPENNHSQLYVFGGLNTGNILSTSHFNSSTAKWQSATDMSIAKRHSCGAVVGHKVYLFGGYSNISLKTAEVYDCSTGTYSQFRSMLNPRYACGAAFLDGFIYVAGGFNSVSLSTVTRFNVKTTQEEIVNPMHLNRYGLQLIELGGRLYAVGGGTKTVEMYDTTVNRWFTVASTNYVHQYFGAAVHEQKIYACSNNGFEVYFPDIDQWKTLPQLNSFEGRTLVSMNGKLWSLGGGASASKSVFTYDTGAEKWIQQQDMDVARKYHTSFVVDH